MEMLVHKIYRKELIYKKASIFAKKLILKRANTYIV